MIWRIAVVHGRRRRRSIAQGRADNAGKQRHYGVSRSLVQLDRLRVGRQHLRLHELADQLGHASHFIIERIAKP